MVQDLLKKCAQSMFCYVRDLGYHPSSEDNLSNILQ